jgi:hypothetical protein
MEEGHYDANGEEIVDAFYTVRGNSADIIYVHRKGDNWTFQAPGNFSGNFPQKSGKFKLGPEISKFLIRIDDITSYLESEKERILKDPVRISFIEKKMDEDLEERR